ncbi:MAG: efflux RND transporter periplasmic adaptor subunit [Candidatus Didemnitutus sp.]|jgi:membrane fusion protein (multidrug efflux system)|nr:efflux RND transporter periplasmic adaptor subunit [Candidatus Didemnitutus sp.]
MHPLRIIKKLGSVSWLAAALALFAAGCSRSAPTPPRPGPVEVEAVEVTTAPVAFTRELPGRTAARRIAQVRARVSGIILKRHFTEGADVKEGELLYEIDPAPYALNLARAQAELQRAESNLAAVRLQAERFKPLVATNAISKQQYDDAVASAGVGEAAVAAAKAAVMAAELDLGYAKVTAPISGRIGLAEVTEGAYVQAGQATLLATVQQIDPIYVNLVQPSTEIERMRREFESGRMRKDGDGLPEVTLLMEDGTEYPVRGQLEFADITVDRSTGSVTLRALFPNPDKRILPGSFVRARYEEGVNPAALLVPQQAVSRNYRGDPTVYVVAADGTAELRPLKVSRAYRDNWVVDSGLKVGEKVIVSNLQRIRPGVPVKPVPLAATPAAPAAKERQP